MTLPLVPPEPEPIPPPQEAMADALELLCREHEHARLLAEDCRRHARSAASDPEARARAERLCLLLRRLSEMEEGLFYPVARAALASPQLVDLAALEHATARQIIRQLQAAEPCEARYEALLLALAECVERHVRHEQRALFPSVREAAVDLGALAARMRARSPSWRVPLTH